MSKRLLCQKTIQKIMRIGLYQAVLSVAFATFAHAYEVSGQKVLEQKVTLQLTNADVERVLDKIENVTKVKFMYNPQIFGAERRLNYKFQNELLSDVLNKVLSPYQVDYEVFQERIILKRQEQQSQPEEKTSMQQEAPKRKITGIVFDEKGSAMPGVSVVVKDTQPGVATRGTTTLADGTFSLDVPEQNRDGGPAVLVFSFVGFKKQEVTVGNQSNISVNLTPESSTLSEVVVTALGIAREKKALAYSVTEVKGNELTQARENNVANALTGKIAGVNATGMATGPGGSSRIIIRGNGSLNGNNQPLYVINGMPMDNSTPGGTQADGNGMNVDRGDGIGGINPDDIESISVLKGGPAAALYGARASNGVILITTKKGRGQKGVGVEINSNTTFEDIAVIPNWQYEYGQGVDGKKPTTVTEAKSTGRLSYGARMDGQPTIQVDGQLHPYSPQKDNLKNFYRTGSNYINSVAFTGGNETVNFRLGLNNTQSNSIVPNSSFNRRIANLNLNAFLGKKLSIETVFQYNIEEGTNRPKVGYADMNPHWATYLIANVVDIRSLSPGYDPVTGKEMEWNPVPAAPNPYFVVNKFKNNDIKHRFISQGSIRYDILDNLFIKGSVSQDYYSFSSEYVQPTNNAYQPLGTYEARKTTSSETNGMLTLNYNTSFLKKDLTFSALAGANAQSSIFDQTIIAGSEFTIPYFYSYTNLAASTTTPTYLKSAINSLFGSVDFGYKNVAYLTVSGRQDWFSVLNPKSNSIFYPSVGGSLILSDAFRLPKAISFAKLRASWAQVGGATVNAYQIYQYYSMQQGGHNGRPVQVLSSSQVPNPDLKPLTSTTYEGGIEAKFLNNRLGIDLTLYNRKTTNDIVTSNIALSSGYTSALLNVGELSNKGVELLLTGTPVKTGNFGWDVSFNMAYNKSKIERLAEGISGIDVGTGVGGGVVRNVVDRPYGTVWGYRKKTDANGNVVFNTASGYAVRGDLEEIGQGTPPLTMGITNTFRYKNFSLNVLVDGKFGSIVYSNLYQYAYRFGLPQETLPGRETGITVTGVTPEGAPFTKTWAKEDVDTYYDNDKNYTSLFMFNNDFVKLRQVILSYNLPVGKLPFKLQSATISFVARNLAILYKDKKNQYFDPESSYTSTNAQGLEAFGVPRTRSLGVNLMVKF